MADPLDPRYRSYYTPKQWRLLQEAAAAEKATEPAGPVPGVPADVWAAMTPAEQAKLYADQANQRAVVAAQHESSRRTRTTLWVIFVVLPAIAVLLYLVATARW